jgi:NAD(P)-dependent dehydrogenase (short-subunit alcohol dehydrogenase family)
MGAPSVLVTGGAKRIGAVLVRTLAAAGYRIALHYHTAETEARTLAAELAAGGGECRLFRADLADRAATAALAEDVCRKMGGLTLLLNNASFFEKRPLRETAPADLDRTLAVNFFAPFILIQQFAAQGTPGQVINILDSTLTGDNPDFAAYRLSRRMLADWTRLAALAYAPQVRVNAIAPGFTLPPETVPPGLRLPDPARLPLGRPVTPAAIAETVLYLEKNPALTGETIFVDGGEHLCRS